MTGAHSLASTAIVTDLQSLYDSTSSNQTTICDIAEATYGGTLDNGSVASDDISDV